MLRFFKEAFFFRIPTRLLGEVPVNLLAVAAFAILGLGHPGFWLLGAGLELSYLLAVGSNPRFQHYVLQRARLLRRDSTLTRLAGVLDSLALLAGTDASVRHEAAGIPRLSLPAPGDARRGLPDTAHRYNALADRVTRVLERYRADRIDEQVARSNQESLHNLLLVYAELLHGLAKLAQLEAAGPRLRAERDALLAALGAGDLAREIEESKRATLETIEKRLAAHERRSVLEARIHTDLQRVEQQVELAWEATLVSGEIGRINADLNVATMLMSDDFEWNSFSTPSPMPRSASNASRTRRLESE